MPIRPLSLVRRLASLFRRDRLDDELTQEIAQHIALRRQALIDNGMEPHAADIEARRSFGNVTRIREETRDMWGFPSLESFVQDIRLGARHLRRSPLFTLVAVASLAIGIGTAAAVLVLANAVLFRKLPVRDPDGLWIVRWVSGPVLPFDSLNGYASQTDTASSSTSFSLAAFEAIRDERPSGVQVVGFADLYRVSLGFDETELANGQAVSGNYFAVMGVPPAAGRPLGPGDDRRNADPVVMISYGLWQRRFGGAPGAIGQPISINGVPATIVGVTPRGFQGAMQVGASPSVFVPLSSAAQLERSDQHFDPNYWWVLMLARLPSGTTAEAAGAAIESIVRQSISEHRPSLPGEAMPRVVLEPGARGQVEERRGMREPLQVLAIVVAVVLLAAIANVAGLMLMRANARAHETAVRLSLGATRWRLMREAQTECLLVGALAGIAALPVTAAVAHVLLPALGRDDSMAVEIGIDGPTTLLTLAVACVATVLCGAASSFRSTVPGATAAAGRSARSVPGGGRRMGPGGVLAGAQVALCLVLVSGAGVLALTVRNLDRIDPGFDASNLLLFRIDPPLSGYEGDRLVHLYDRLLAGIRSLPGVESATVSAHTPIADSASILRIRLPGDPPPDSESAASDGVGRPLVWRQTVEDAFFQTMRIPVIAGRTLDGGDSPTSQKVAVVNARFVRDVLGGAPAIGRRFHLGGGADAPEVEIVGVVGDARFSRMRADVPPTAYVSYRQQRVGAMTFEVRTAGDPLASVPAIRRAVADGAPGVPMFDVRTQEAQIAYSLRRERLFARLATMLGAVTLILCAIGVYGLLATHVMRRTAEVGVRMALGAAPATVRWMVIRQGLLLVGGGVAIGVPAALGGLRVVESLLYGVRPTDPLAIAFSVILLAAVGVLAAWLPARRASHVDPVVALRQS